MIRLPSHAALGLAVAVAWTTMSSTAAAADPPSVTWRGDYNTARKEAQEKGKLIVLVIGTEDCLYCRKQEASTFRDPTVQGLVNDHFLAVKVDANRDPNLAQALKIQLYPTTVLAGPDGKILAYLQGFVSAEQFKEHANRAVLQATTSDAISRSMDEVNKAISNSDHVKAIVLLKLIISDAGEAPIRVKAEKMLATLETHAAEKLSRAKQLDGAGDASSSLAQLADIVRQYAGTSAAAEAAGLLTVPAKGDWSTKIRAVRAKNLIDSAREDYEGKRYADCLEKCQLVVSQHPESQEAALAQTMSNNIRSEPEVLLAICEQMNERTAGLYFALAESWSKKGEMKQAQSCLERVMRLTPGSKTADAAQVRLASLHRNSLNTIPASISK
jgi:thioredoxin-related protein